MKEEARSDSVNPTIERKCIGQSPNAYKIYTLSVSYHTHNVPDTVPTVPTVPTIPTTEPMKEGYLIAVPDHDHSTTLLQVKRSKR